MMKAGHLMTMTRNNGGERRARSFNTHTNRASSSPSPSDTSANYDYGRRSDVVSFEHQQQQQLDDGDIGGSPSPHQHILVRGGGKNSQQQQQQQRRQYSQPLESSPRDQCSLSPLPTAQQRLVADSFLATPTSPIGRSASLRSSRGSSRERDSGESDGRPPSQSSTAEQQQPPRLQRRSGSARDRSKERRRAEYASATETYRYRERRCVVSNVNYQLHPPPTIVTTLDEPELAGGSLDAKLSPRSSALSSLNSDDTEFYDDPFSPAHWTATKQHQQHLLAVPGYESPTNTASSGVIDDQATTRSRSRSAPSNNDLRHKPVHLTRSDACAADQTEIDRSNRSSRLYDEEENEVGYEDDEEVDTSANMHPQRLYHRKSNPDNNYDSYYNDRPPIDRRVSYNPIGGSGAADELTESAAAAAAAAYREKGRKYSCAVDTRGSSGLGVGVGGGGGGGAVRCQPPELRRIASTGVASGGGGSGSPSEAPRRRILPLTPDELIQRQREQKSEEPYSPITNHPTSVSAAASYLDVNYGAGGTGGGSGSKKPFLLPSSSLPGSTGHGGGQDRDTASSTASASVQRQLSGGLALAGGGSSFLKVNEARTCQQQPSTSPLGSANKPLVAPITRDNAPMISASARSSSASASSSTTVAPSTPPVRPGSGRKLPAEPSAITAVETQPGATIQAHSSPSKSSLFRISRQNAVHDQRPSSQESHDLFTRMNMYSSTASSSTASRSMSRPSASKSSSSDDDEDDADDDEEGEVEPVDWPSPTQTNTPTPSSEASSKTAVLTSSNRSISGSQSLFKKFNQSSVSSSSSVPDFQVTPSCPNGSQSVDGDHQHQAGGHYHQQPVIVSSADPATDSGHGSGAESAVGDGATVSASNSWPDAIVLGNGGVGTSGFGGSKTPAAAGSLISVAAPVDPSSRRGSAVTISPPPSPSVGSLGLVHFSLQYFPVRKRLRVSVIKAELKIEAELNAFVKICLNPGKQQKQKGERMVKRSKEATFNEEFFFDNITVDDLETKHVHVRLCHHVGKQFQKDVIIGQMEISLKDVQSILLGKQEVKMCQELKVKQLKKLGRLQISTCLEKEARRLTINIFKADDLPKFGITGAPDPFVRITVDQNGWIQTKQSRTLKSTCNAVFKEAIMFLVSTKPTDLERTKITVAVHDAGRGSISSEGIDDLIGNVYLGQLACDKTELEQWKNSMTHFGREFKASHQLKWESTAMASEDSRVSADDDY